MSGNCFSKKYATVIKHFWWDIRQQHEGYAKNFFRVQFNDDNC
jgi:hypothetical protein